MSPAALRPLLTQIAWAHVLIFFDFNLNSFDLLADFLGWFILADGLKKLTEELPGLSLLRPLALTLGCWEVFLAFAPIFGLDPDAQLPAILPLILRILRLYFDFQLLTDLAQLAARYEDAGQPPRRLGRTFLRVRNVQVVLDTLLAVPLIYPALNDHPWAIWALLIFGLGVMITVLYCLFSLRNLIPSHAVSPDSTD